MDDQKMFLISLDDKPYNVKKFKLQEKLSDIRKVLNINEYYEFINENGFSIEIDDEENYTLDNLFEDKKKGTFTLKCRKCTKKIIVVINNKEKIEIECLLKDNLSTIREILNNEIKEKFQFIYNEKFLIDEPEEGEFTVNDIIKNNKISIKLNEKEKILIDSSEKKSINKKNLNDSNNSNNSNDCSENEKYYSIVCDNKSIGKHKFSNSSTLEEIRKKLDSLIPENSFFLEGNERIAKNSEKYIDVNKIADESNIIFLQSNSKKEEDSNNNNILKEDKLNEEKKDLSQKETPKEKKRYKILINGKLYFRNFYPSEKLEIIRDELGELISTNARFYYQDSEIDVDDETTTTIEEIIENNKPEIIIKDLFLEKKLDDISLSPLLLETHLSFNSLLILYNYINNY